MPRTRFGKKKDNTYEAEVDSELASEFYSDERGDAEVVEAQVVDFIYYFALLIHKVSNENYILANRYNPHYKY